jgi:hypothetical protein|tara:strand:- start:206 stop:388 length:183 start_codon:yes stop_codon:yes gene_type:complete
LQFGLDKAAKQKWNHLYHRIDERKQQEFVVFFREKKELKHDERAGERRANGGRRDIEFGC